MIIHKTLEVTVGSTPLNTNMKSISDDIDEKFGNA